MRFYPVIPLLSASLGDFDSPFGLELLDGIQKFLATAVFNLIFVGVVAVCAFIHDVVVFDVIHFLSFQRVVFILLMTYRQVREELEKKMKNILYATGFILGLFYFGVINLILYATGFILGLFYFGVINPMLYVIRTWGGRHG